MPKIWIKNGKIWSGECFFDGDLFLDNGRISSISKKINDQADFVYDASGQIVSAGLVDAHTHLRGLSSNVLGVSDFACFPFGVTSAVDAWAEQLDEGAMRTSGVKTLAFIGSWVVDNLMQYDYSKRLLSVLKEKAVGIKLCFDVAGAEVRDISPLIEVMDFAIEHDLKVMVHCNRSPVPMMDIVKVLRKGDVLTHAYHGGVNNASEDGFACLKYAKEKGVIIDAGFAGHVHTDFGVYRQALENGCFPDVIGSDITLYSAFKRGGRYGLTSCMNIARVCGQDEESIFKCVTSTPAKVFGKADEWGYLEEGRVADVAVFAYENDAFDLTDENGNHVAWEKGYRCKLTVANGEVVFKD